MGGIVGSDTWLERELGAGRYSLHVVRRTAAGSVQYSSNKKEINKLKVV